MSTVGKELYEHLELLHAHCEDTLSEASFDFVLNELIRATNIAAQHDYLGHAMAADIAAKSFQRRYRKTDTPEIGFRGPAYDEPI